MKGPPKSRQKRLSNRCFATSTSGPQRKLYAHLTFHPAAPLSAFLNRFTNSGSEEKRLSGVSKLKNRTNSPLFYCCLLITLSVPTSHSTPWPAPPSPSAPSSAAPQSPSASSPAPRQRARAPLRPRARSRPPPRAPPPRARALLQLWHGPLGSWRARSVRKKNDLSVPASHKGL
jgi:hypothetical protein